MLDAFLLLKAAPIKIFNCRKMCDLCISDSIKIETKRAFARCKWFFSVKPPCFFSQLVLNEDACRTSEEAAVIHK